MQFLISIAKGIKKEQKYKKEVEEDSTSDRFSLAGEKRTIDDKNFDVFYLKN